MPERNELLAAAIRTGAGMLSTRQIVEGFFSMGGGTFSRIDPRELQVPQGVTLYPSVTQHEGTLRRALRNPSNRQDMVESYAQDLFTAHTASDIAAEVMSMDGHSPRYDTRQQDYFMETAIRYNQPDIVREMLEHGYGGQQSAPDRMEVAFALRNGSDDALRVLVDHYGAQEIMNLGSVGYASAALISQSNPRGRVVFTPEQVRDAISRVSEVAEIHISSRVEVNAFENAINNAVEAGLFDSEVMGRLLATRVGGGEQTFTGALLTDGQGKPRLRIGDGIVGGSEAAAAAALLNINVNQVVNGDINELTSQLTELISEHRGQRR